MTGAAVAAEVLGDQRLSVEFAMRSSWAVNDCFGEVERGELHGLQRRFERIVDAFLSEREPA